MAHSEDDIALAAEYALGTLDADERAQAESRIAAEPDFAALAETWERRLGALNQMVGSVEPRPELWDHIRGAIGSSGPQQPAALPPTEALPPSRVDSAPSPASAAEWQPLLHEAVDASGRGLRGWQSFASAASALAAALAVFIGLQIFRPGLLPERLRPKAEVRVVQAPAPAPAASTAASSQYVALLQASGQPPAFILTVDAATAAYTVRRLTGAADAGKSYELWLVSDKLPQPRSLGVIGANEFTSRPVLKNYDPQVVANATYAVSLEPAGGAPNGVATGPIMFTGKLIETVPANTRPG